MLILDDSSLLLPNFPGVKIWEGFNELVSAKYVISGLKDVYIKSILYGDV